MHGNSSGNAPNPDKRKGSLGHLIQTSHWWKR